MTQQIIDGQTAGWATPEVLLPEIPQQVFQIGHYGAVGDGITDNTAAFHEAIRVCAQAGGGKLIIPAGLWLTGSLKLESKLELHLEAGATLLFSKNFDDYPLIHSTFEGLPAVRCQSPLDGEGLEDVAITGAGVVDGGGEAWRPVKNWKMTQLQWNQLLEKGGAVDSTGTWWPSEGAMNGAKRLEELLQAGKREPADFEEVRDFLRPNLLSLRRCKRILLDGPTFQNSPAWNLHPWASEHVTLRNLTVRNPWFAQNGDGLDLDSCRYAIVENCMFDVGDDAICMKSGKDKAGRDLGIPSEYITIRGCTVYHGHGGFVVGSEMSGGVRYVEVSDCTFMGTDIGIRFKTARGRGGIVEHILMKDIRMIDIEGEAISFSMFYEGLEGSGTLSEDTRPVTEETPVFRNITLENIVCTGADAALVIKGLAEMPVEGISIHGYKATAIEGVMCANARGLNFSDVVLQVKQGPLLKLHQCEDAQLVRVGGTISGQDDRLLMATGDRTTGITIKEPQTQPAQRRIAADAEIAKKIRYVEGDNA
ncbi:MAG: glycoside hydrolase family 28 [Paenibacillaceae bacterium]|nr:glycoside hydrolase family 28 [Paenibacillaceae bacterium]